MHPSRRLQLLVRKRLHPKTHAVDSGPRPGRRFSFFHRFRVRLQGHLCKPSVAAPVHFNAARSFRRERVPNRLQNSLQLLRLQQTGCPASKVNRIDEKLRPVALATRCLRASRGHWFIPSFQGPLVHPELRWAASPHHSRRLQQLPMPPNLPAQGLHIRRKPFLRHHPRMKIAIGALRLAEGHLHVDSKPSHGTKTLAHLPQRGSAPRLIRLILEDCPETGSFLRKPG